MPIYHKQRSICIFIPKTGCTFLHNNIFKADLVKPLEIFYGWDEINKKAYGHATYLEIKDRTSNFKGIENYRFFAFVRNPFTRLVSEYLYNINNIHIKYEPDFNEFVKKIKDTYMKDWYLGCHLKPQSEFLINETGQISKRIRIYHFEMFSRNIDTICKLVDVPLLSHEIKEVKVNSSNYVKNYRHYYNEESIAIVQELYADDFRNFRYSTDLWPKTKTASI